ncbi:MAG: DUF5103 domain-containing protein [Leeuwenhoekiella sp.]
MKTAFSLVCLLTVIAIANAQVAVEVPAPAYIKTVQFQGNTLQSQLPLIELGTTLRLSFDDVIGDEADYYYNIDHYNADWTPSVLAQTEYMRGYDGMRIFDYTNSVATLQLYTHYELTIPNQNTQALIKSGNYLLTIKDANDKVVFSRKFMIYENIATVGVEVLRSRDPDMIEVKQVVNFKVDGGDYLLINPEKNVKPLIIQNNNLHRTIFDIPPRFNIGNVLEYRYDNETSFFAGNEFLNFENKNVRAANNFVQYIELEGLYHNYLFANIPRADQIYTYNPDINGNFLINTINGTDPRTQSEYVWVHFTLNMLKLPEGQEVFVTGAFNNFDLTESVKMIYNPQKRRYELPLLLKQGFYNYRYSVTENGLPLPYHMISGDFWQTENVYDVLIYYRPPGGRFDQIIGAGQALSTNISNVRRN